MRKVRLHGNQLSRQRLPTQMRRVRVRRKVEMVRLKVWLRRRFEKKLAADAQTFNLRLPLWYVDLHNRTSSSSFICPDCRAESWNPHDVENGYCGVCHDWPYDRRKETST